MKQFKSKPLKGLTQDEWGSYSTKKVINIEKLDFYRNNTTAQERKENAKKAHENVDWVKVNSSKDNKAIHKHRMLKVYAWDYYTNDFINEYESMMEAGRQLGLDQGNISSGIDKNAKRGKYRFTSKKVKPTYKNLIRKVSQVECYDLEGKLVNTYTSISEAARAVKVSTTAIIGAIKRNGKSAGYKWKEC